jgi:hypothetical protein
MKLALLLALKWWQDLVLELVLEYGLKLALVYRWVAAVGSSEIFAVPLVGSLQ